MVSTRPSSVLLKAVLAALALGLVAQPAIAERVGAGADLGAGRAYEAEGQAALGGNEAIRVYVEFADGGNRGMYDPRTGGGGLPDEDYDATTAMVVTWHRLPEAEPSRDARLRYRRVHPSPAPWMIGEGESFEFWHREERINRVLLRGLDPGSVYELQVREGGEVFRFRTMPASLTERSVKIVITADLQTATWTAVAHDNAKMAALQAPDMFIVAGDFVSCSGCVTPENAQRWATYLDRLYGVPGGYFHYDGEIDGIAFDRLIIPHLSVLGNHETGRQQHLRWPACVNTSMAAPGYPTYVAANWMELLFHWPYGSEGFLSEFNPRHPNIDPEFVREGFGHGGFGKLSFSNYLMIVGLDNSQNFEGAPDVGLRDWEGNLITDRWPWFETLHAEVRQDEWLRNLFESADGPPAGEVYTHVLPIWHRGLFGPVRLNMSLKNRGILEHWLPVLYRNGVRIIHEGHDHVFTRTVPIRITAEQPANTYLEKVHYEPNSWELVEGLSPEYLDAFFAVNCLKDEDTGEIVGWEYAGNFATYDPQGMIVIGHGGWAAGRREPGQRSGGNAGWWFVDEEKGGKTFGGRESFHLTTVHLRDDGLTVEAFRPDQLVHFENGGDPQPLHRFRWDRNTDRWGAFLEGSWVAYEDAAHCSEASRTGIPKPELGNAGAKRAQLPAVLRVASRCSMRASMLRASASCQRRRLSRKWR